MSAQPSVVSDHDDYEVLDVETSAALLRWLETGEIPEGVDRAEWERWTDEGCRQSVLANGIPLDAPMLGHWARTGRLPLPSVP
jgi:hypothetical protein